MRLGRGYHAVWTTPQGGSILQWQYREHTILGPPRVALVGGDLKDRGVSHWCFPNFGPVPAGVLSDNQQHGWLRETVMDIHGFSHEDAQFRTSPEDGDGDGDTDVQVSVSLTEDGVSTELFATNRGDQPMPVLPAYHPYFTVPASGGLEVRMNAEVLAYVMPTTRIHKGIPHVARIISRTGVVSVALFGIGEVILKLGGHCTHIVIWSDDPMSYVCVEPIFGTPGTFGTAEGRWLKPGEQTFCQVGFEFRPF